MSDLSEKHALESGMQPAVEEKGNALDATATYTPEEERQVLRKIDRTILPLICIVFFMQYLDKQSLSYTSVFGLLTDLNLTSTQYSWCSSIFFVGQLVAEFPFIYLMSKLPLTKLVGVTVIIWGIVCMCLAAPTNFAGFATVRFLLGFTEGAVSPAFVTITSIWYQKSEHATRTGLWVTMNGLAQIAACILMYGIGKNNSLALAHWRVMFIVCGAMTVASGIAFYFLMPNGPNDAWFLNAREKEVLSLRMARDREGGDKTSFSVRQLREALLDIKTWFVFAFGVLITMQSPVLTFASLVINTIGYDKYQTMLYTAPSGAVQIMLLWVGMLGCRLFPHNRTHVILALIIPPLIGNILLLRLSLSAGWGMIAASWLASCLSAAMSPLLSLTASNAKGNTKRAVVSAVFFIGYCAGCIASPQLWTQKPRYFNGVVTALVTWCTLFVVVVAYWLVCKRDNARRDAKEREGGSDEGALDVVLDKNGAPVTDLTDKEDSRFRYSW
ncbi:major facilitator superfamily transporter [Boeremia exigua]|uniref:major facilitator superfamily transporter n=1 Tax=Boeremia exigua TaxID=749465 RepID=UPI001E8D8167|nr:major facilitator superfamily transporter [Boeremia exigua]KAH6625154.1 major facilitator superfamily transporter [Boeremia exigua]